MEGYFTQRKNVSKEMHKVYLETLEVEDLFRGSARQGGKGRLKTKFPVLNAQE